LLHPHISQIEFLEVNWNQSDTVPETRGNERKASSTEGKKEKGHPPQPGVQRRFKSLWGNKT